jgi:copper resistance protein B
MRCAVHIIIAGFVGLCAGAANAQHDMHEHNMPAPQESPEMADARHMVQMHHGAENFLYVQGDRFEYGSGDGNPYLLWDAQGWYGGDIHKLWVKTEGEVLLDGGEVEEAELQALYSRAIWPFFDLQAGVRHDFEPGPQRTYGVVGLQGLAPYMLEVDAAAFVSNKGDVSARIELEYDLLITQRLIAQPRAELNFALQDVPEHGIGSGLSSADLGLRLRYEFVREFAPYIGVSWSRAVGNTAEFARSASEDPSTVSFVAGLRFWF